MKRTGASTQSPGIASVFWTLAPPKVGVSSRDQVGLKFHGTWGGYTSGQVISEDQGSITSVQLSRACVMQIKFNISVSSNGNILDTDSVLLCEIPIPCIWQTKRSVASPTRIYSTEQMQHSSLIKDAGTMTRYA